MLASLSIAARQVAGAAALINGRSWTLTSLVVSGESLAVPGNNTIVFSVHTWTGKTGHVEHSGDVRFAHDTITLTNQVIDELPVEPGELAIWQAYRDYLAGTLQVMVTAQTMSLSSSAARFTFTAR